MFKPKKYLGQNCLKNPEIVSKIIDAAEIKSTDTIIEIGPGTGILTEQLIKTGAQIFAIEKDFDLISRLKENIGSPKNLKVIHQDALWLDVSSFTNYKVVANIPYQITSPLIRKFLEAENKPGLMVLMVQKEVAERICAKPGDSNRGLLTIIIEFYADVEMLFEVSRQEFYPVPKVDSGVIRIKTKKQLDKKIDEKKFFKIVKAGFSSKRKQLHNSLSATFHWNKDQALDILSKAKIDPTLRAEDLTLEQWLKLYEVF